MDVKPFGSQDRGKLFTAFFEVNDNCTVVWGRVREVNERGILTPAFEPVSFGLHSFIPGEKQVMARLIVNGKMQTPDCNYFGIHSDLESANFWESTAKKFLPGMTTKVLSLELGAPPPLLLHDEFGLRRGDKMSGRVVFHGLAVYEGGRAWLLTGPNVDCFGVLLKELIRVPGRSYAPREFTFVPAGDASPFQVIVEAM